jgi:hypothetical protein
VDQGRRGLEVERARSYLADYESSFRKEALARKADVKPGADKGQEPTSAPKPNPAVPQNPDEIDQAGEPVKDEVIQLTDPRTAAWASFCQALLGSAEFRYLR